MIGSAALEAAAVGLRVFPVEPRGKKPLRRGWRLSATSDVAVVAATWRKVPDANVGVACGSGLLVIDTDSAAGEAALREFNVPDTPTVRTARGRHLYLRGLARNRESVLPGVDVRGEGGFVIGAGSMHASGAEYRWELTPSEVAFGDVPAELLALLQAKTRRRAASTAAGSPAVFAAGQRNTSLFRLACKQRGIVGLDYQELLATLLTVNERRCRPPLDRREVEKIAASACSYGEPPLWATDHVAYARDPQLTAAARQLLMVLASRGNADHECWPGIRSLHADTRLAKETVAKHLVELQAAGRIKIERRKGCSTLYRLLPPPERLSGSSGATEGGSSVLPSRTPEGAA